MLTTNKPCSPAIEEEKYEAGDWETVSEASDVSEDTPTYSFETISKEQQICLQHEALRFLGEHGKSFRACSATKRNIEAQNRIIRRLSAQLCKQKTQESAPNILRFYDPSRVLA